MLIIQQSPPTHHLVIADKSINKGKFQHVIGIFTEYDFFMMIRIIAVVGFEISP